MSTDIRLAMVTALNRPEEYPALFLGGTWRELHSGVGGFCVDTPATKRPLLVLDPEDPEQLERLLEAVSEWADRVPYSDMRKPGDLTPFDAMQAALRSLLSPPKCYRSHRGTTAPWPMVAECHSSNIQGHECPQCAWEHEHDWVEWVNPPVVGPSSVPAASGLPVRCSKCGGRKCDRDDCAARRHAHTHAEAAA